MKRSHWVSKSRSLHSRFSLCGAKSMPFLALGSRWEIVRILSLPTRRPWREKKGGQAAKSPQKCHNLQGTNVCCAGTAVLLDTPHWPATESCRTDFPPKPIVLWFCSFYFFYWGKETKTTSLTQKCCEQQLQHVGVFSKAGGCARHVLAVVPQGFADQTWELPVCWPKVL